MLRLNRGLTQFSFILFHGETYKLALEQRKNPMTVPKQDNMTVRDGLQRLRDEQFSKLVALASDKREAERILQQIRVLEQALDSCDAETENLKYAKHKSAILAILAYLNEIGRPVSQTQIIAELLVGGWRHGDDKAETHLKQSIASFVSGLGRKTKQIKQINGLIGRGDWDDSMFVE